ncbi:hypothetical protein ABT337_15605 [Saccharopolyspora hirsuta]|uniref:hypothetical protein n=1 Tax=Saccharopolyspora hirsuta TaxID=1837 RepID=UPI00331880B1
MSALRNVAALQARVYEFLEGQDEQTLQAIVSGSVRLTIARTDGAPADPAPREAVRVSSRRGSAGRNGAPPHDPALAAQDLSGLASEHERRTYLNTAGFTVKKLRATAKQCGLTGYSKLTREALVDLLVNRAPDQLSNPAGQTARTTPSYLAEDSDNKQQSATQGARPSPPATSSDTPPNVDAAAIALRLRKTDTVEEGAAYLDSLHLGREGLLAIAAELQLTRVDRLSQKELKRRVLKQAISARRKFAGLRKW